MNVPSATPPDSGLYRNQGDKLPRLPVPKLADTLARLSRSCEPLAADKAQLDALHHAYVLGGGVPMGAFVPADGAGCEAAA